MQQLSAAASLPIRYLGLAYAQRLTAAPRLLRYSVAVCFFLIALVARFGLVNVLPDKGFPFLTFFPAVLLTAYLAGFGPGLLREAEKANIPFLAALPGALRRCSSLVWLATRRSERLALHPASAPKNGILTISASLSSALSVLAAGYFFVQPDRSARLAAPDLVALVFFSSILVIDCLVIHFMKTALARIGRTERQLRESGHRLRLVLDNLYMYVGILGLDGTLNEVNEEPVRAAGLNRSDILGRPLWDASWWAGDIERQNEVRAAIKQAAAGNSVRFDIEVKRSSQKFTIDFQVGPLRDSDGNITALVASGVNVTARMDAIVALEASRHDAVIAAEAAESERRVLDTIFNAVPAAIFVADVNGKLLRMNRATEQIWGDAPFSRDMGSYGEWKGWWADGSARHGQRLQSHDWGMARSLQGLTCNDIVEVEPFGRPSERLITLLSSAPVLDPSGRGVGGVVAQVDITARINAEKALRASEERFRALFDNGPIAIYSCDASGTIQEFNRSAVELSGRAPRPGETDEQFRAAFKYFLPDGTLLPNLKSRMPQFCRVKTLWCMTRKSSSSGPTDRALLLSPISFR